MLTPLIIHFELTMNIIEGMTGISSLPIDYKVISSLPRSLFIINIWVLFYFFSKQRISKKDLLLQILNVILLLFAFYYLPLIMGFTLYFVFYHAYGSMLDQMTFLKQQELNFLWKMYFKNALPTTLLAIGFIITCFVVNDYFDFGYSIIQMFFVILSLFTLPHILLIEQVFSQTKVTEIKALQVI
jgi:Brp/Blh family beta-carotene 15,15'-monooxygenase